MPHVTANLSEVVLLQLNSVPDSLVLVKRLAGIAVMHPQFNSINQQLPR